MADRAYQCFAHLREETSSVGGVEWSAKSNESQFFSPPYVASEKSYGRPVVVMSVGAAYSQKPASQKCAAHTS